MPFTDPTVVGTDDDELEVEEDTIDDEDDDPTSVFVVLTDDEPIVVTRFKRATMVPEVTDPVSVPSFVGLGLEEEEDKNFPFVPVLLLLLLLLFELLLPSVDTAELEEPIDDDPFPPLLLLLPDDDTEEFVPPKLETDNVLVKEVPVLVLWKSDNVPEILLLLLRYTALRYSGTRVGEGGRWISKSNVPSVANKDDDGRVVVDNITDEIEEVLEETEVGGTIVLVLSLTEVLFVSVLPNRDWDRRRLLEPFRWREGWTGEFKEEVGDDNNPPFGTEVERSAYITVDEVTSFSLSSSLE